jgi:hypothetical protein
MTHEPTNFHRAAWAKQAFAAFAEATDNAAVDRLHPHDLSDTISDLMCDLLHLANLSNLHPGHIVAQAQANYEAELLEVLS